MNIDIPRSEPSFERILGLTDPCPIAVHMEPFSTSVFKVLIWIVATTTKIYTRHGSTESHDKGFCTVPTPSYSLRHHICRTVVEYRQRTWASSIFRANSFGRWVVTSKSHHELHDFSSSGAEFSSSRDTLSGGLDYTLSPFNTHPFQMVYHKEPTDI